jgi:hypothetical protein
MTQQKFDLNQCDIVLRHRKDCVVAAIPRFGLFAQADTVQGALDALAVKRAALQADLDAFEELSARDSASAQEFVPFPWRDIRVFAAKAAIVFLLLTAAATYLAIRTQQIVDSAWYKVETNIQRVALTSGRTFWSNVERELDRAADPTSDLPDEKKQKLLSDIRRIADRWRPFVTEVSGILSPSNAPLSQGVPNK